MIDRDRPNKAYGGKVALKHVKHTKHLRRGYTVLAQSCVTMGTITREAAWTNKRPLSKGVQFGGMFDRLRMLSPDNNLRAMVLGAIATMSMSLIVKHGIFPHEVVGAVKDVDPNLMIYNLRAVLEDSKEYDKSLILVIADDSKGFDWTGCRTYARCGRGHWPRRQGRC
jgi:hypothetical protein